MKNLCLVSVSVSVVEILNVCMCQFDLCFFGSSSLVWLLSSLIANSLYYHRNAIGCGYLTFQNSVWRI